MNEFIEYHRIYVKNKLRILYKKQKGKTIYIRHHNEMIPYNKYKKTHGGLNPYRYYINNKEYIDIYEYKNFLKHIKKDLNIIYNKYGYQVVTNTNMCNCNIGKLTNIKYLTSGSNDIYLADIKGNCKSNSIYFQNNIKHVILKICNQDTIDPNLDDCAFVAHELLTHIYYSHLIVNNITSNLLLLFGFIRNCKLKDNNNNNLISNNKKTILFNNYINGNIFKNTTVLTIRQIFELIYTIICCYANYGYFNTDIHEDNFMLYNDSFNTCITIKDHIFYFPMLESVCLIDYQTMPGDHKNIIPINNYIIFLKKYVKPDIANQIQNIKNGTVDEVLNSFINCPCFQQYKIRDKKQCINNRDLIFKILSK